MGSGCDYRCKKCGYSFRTSNSWEFYRDEQGEIQCYGHPGPTSAEAKKRGVYGFMDTEYCLNCRKLVDIMLVEFDKPVDHHAAWGITDSWAEPRCPDCSKTDFLDSHSPDENIRNRIVVCPKCKAGKLVRERSWIS